MKIYSKREIDSIHINRKAVKGKYYKGYDGILYQGQANGTVIRYHLNTITRTEIEWQSDQEVYDQNLILSTSDKTYPGSNQRKYKICDGKKTWKQLDYFSSGGSAPALTFVSVDGITITGDGTPGNPLVAAFLSWVLSVTDDGNGVVEVDNTDTENPVIVFNGVNVSGDISGNGTAGSPLTVTFGTITGTGLFIFMSGGDQATTSATLANITDLVTPSLEANSRYEFCAHIHIGCNNTGGVHLAVDIPSGSVFATLMGRSTSNTAFLQQQFLTDATAHGTAFNRFNNASGGVFIFGSIITGVTPGAANFMFASGTGGETSTIYESGTWIFIKKVA